MPELQKRGICYGMHRTGTLKKGRKFLPCNTPFITLLSLLRPLPDVSGRHRPNPPPAYRQ
ncbi:hypothetical protein DL714_12085 [Shigella flexneri]|nr:hypothetical protein [Shigella flexneri]EFY0279019.1 hypothetical protein [Shigella flexneri]EFY9794253.1 hypothetical protein [Shigella flexneri]EFY9822484.1 hypothetical protein [Shigella flexneri]EFZ0490043.1 hypothetical protein [Shigella flexneri]